MLLDWRNANLFSFFRRKYYFVYDMHAPIVGEEGRPITSLFYYIDTIIFHAYENIILFTFVVKIMNVRNLHNYNIG